MTRIASIVLAAGSSVRMGVSKQFLELVPGVRIIDRVVATCRSATDWVGVVVPQGTAWAGAPVEALIDGGATRFHSLLAGAAAVPPDAEIVVVHSASHPLASVELLERVIGAVERGADGAVPVLGAVDAIKRRHADGTLTSVGREGLVTAQAPTAYARSLLDRALGAVETVIEESAAVEAIGGRIVAVAGELINLHITDRASLEVVRHLAGLDDVRRPPG